VDQRREATNGNGRAPLSLSLLLSLKFQLLRLAVLALSRPPTDAAWGSTLVEKMELVVPGSIARPKTKSLLQEMVLLLAGVGNHSS
jgi:hypothetical protein